MKHLIFTALASLLIAAGFGLQAQEIPCYTDEMYEQKVAENPEILQIRNEVHDRLISAAAKPENRQKSGGSVRIIPVVFHIIHEGGPENISKEQIDDAMRILNEDYRRLNADAANTRQIFQGIAADSEIEFRLANKDPQGNCTNGIVRVYSPLTNGAHDNVKNLSGWPNNKYLNVWVVKSIENDGQGTILGFAYLPDVVFWGPGIDGIVVRNDFLGKIGTSSSSRGRTLTHEVGHYLGLPHTFQDGCFGSGDDIDDTPKAESANYGCDLSTNSCTNENPDHPDQIENYMDYSNDNCQNMFTQGQKAVFNSTFNIYRSNLISQSNLAATGTDDAQPDLCAPIAEFQSNTQQVCAGGSVTFEDMSWQAEPASWNWSFPGGTPSSSTDPTPTVTYNTPGVYDVSLTATNSTGSNSITKTDYVIVNGTADFTASWGYQESFENETVYNDKWLVLNNDNAAGWNRVSTTSYSGSFCMRMTNFSNTEGNVDELISPSFDLSVLSSPSFTFKLAYAQKNNDSSDRLRVYVSPDCGETWQLRWVKAGATLATVDPQGAPFTPSSTSQWEEIEVALPNTIANSNNVKFKFEFTAGGGNMLYIDDININYFVGVEEAAAKMDLQLFPNPTNDQTTLSFSLEQKEDVNIIVNDITGRTVHSLYSGTLGNGNHRFQISKGELGSAGLYFLTIRTDEHDIVKKLIVQ